MTPFYTLFPEQARRETRCIHVIAPGDDLPMGGYAFIELYCEDLDCDCRRVILQVTPESSPRTILATINFGWETAEFYTRWMHGDAQAGRDITSASLDPINPQSKYADHLLDLFRSQLMTDPNYVARLARHYDQYKAALRNPDAAEPRPAPAPPVLQPGAIPEILRQFQCLPKQCDFAPYEAALLAAIAQREAITPELIAAIDRVADDPIAYLKEKHEDCRHLFAIYLLAQFREPRALNSFLRFFSLPDEQALDLTGDLVTESGAAVLASVCRGDPAPLLGLAHNEAASSFVRGEAIKALAVQALWGERPRAEVLSDLRRLFHTLPKPGDGFVWAALVMLAHDFDAPELAPEARQAFAEKLVDESILNRRGFEQYLRERRQLAQDFRDRYAPIDAVSECFGWTCFQDELADDDLWEDVVEGADTDGLPSPVDDLPPVSPYDIPKPAPYLAPTKVGRNEPCPCGSGKKYKKCCGT